MCSREQVVGKGMGIALRSFAGSYCSCDVIRVSAGTDTEDAPIRTNYSGVTTTS
jgi:hypothetical protein